MLATMSTPLSLAGSLMSFKVDGRTAFEIPLQEVSQVTSGKNEVTLEFHQGETTPVSLLEMRFYVPPNTGEEGPDPVQVAMTTGRQWVWCGWTCQ